MKKLLIIFVGILSFIGISSVKADTIEFDYSNDYVSYYSNQGFDFLKLDSFYSYYGNQSEIVNRLYELVYDYYVENYKEEYPYYYVSIIPWSNHGKDFKVSTDINHASIHACLYPLKDPLMYSDILYYNPTDNILDLFGINSYFQFSDSSYVIPYESIMGSSLSLNYNYNIFVSFPEHQRYPFIYNPLVYYASNFDLVFDLDDTYVVKENNNTLYTFNNGDIVSPYTNSSSINDNNYTTINLNENPYVILSLKDYSKTESFDTNIYSKGQTCITSVYDYGMKERKDVLSGSKMQRCNPLYEDFTKIRFSVLSQDLKNNAVYYVKGYNSNIDNSIKVDSSIFDIHYISEEDKDNPIVNINGKKYSVLPYSGLSDTASKSEDEDYIDGVSEDFSFTDLFTAPVEFLKSVWNSITSVFSLVNSFLSVLPEPLPTFLTIAFTLALALGLIKIIL